MRPTERYVTHLQLHAPVVSPAVLGDVEEPTAGENLVEHELDEACLPQVSGKPFAIISLTLNTVMVCSSITPSVGIDLQVMSKNSS